MTEMMVQIEINIQRHALENKRKIQKDMKYINNITATLLKLGHFSDNLSDKLKYEPSVAIKSDEYIPYTVE